MVGNPQSAIRNPRSRLLAALHCDRGGAAVSFILTFPIFLIIVAIVVQYALLANAKVALDHAARSAARAAVTSLPDEQPQNVSYAAWLALAPLSPVATSPVAAQALATRDALQRLGIDVTDSFPARYTYAMQATNVRWSPEADYPRSFAREADVTLTYRFHLTVPGAMRLIGADDTVGGVSGRFLTLVSTCRIHTAHGRKAGS